MANFREITVNDKKFGWTVGKFPTYRELKIWENRQIVHRAEITSEEEITPSLVEKIIKRNNL